MRTLLAILIGFASLTYGTVRAAEEEKLPGPGTSVVNKERGELILRAVVRHPRDKPCIDDWGQRIQAFVGCGKAAGGDAKMLGYFVFVVDVPTETVYDGLVRLGAETRVHYSMEEGHKHSGLKATTKPEDYLQGDPVALSIFWKDGERWVERPIRISCASASWWTASRSRSRGRRASYFTAAERYTSPAPAASPVRATVPADSSPTIAFRSTIPSPPFASIGARRRR